MGMQWRLNQLFRALLSCSCNPLAANKVVTTDPWRSGASSPRTSYRRDRRGGGAPRASQAGQRASDALLDFPGLRECHRLDGPLDRFGSLARGLRRQQPPEDGEKAQRHPAISSTRAVEASPA
jgi:hypothetical protein